MCCVILCVCWEGLPGRPVSECCDWLSKCYKVICDWLLPALDLKGYGGGLAVNRSRLPPILGLGRLPKGPGLPRPVATCQLSLNSAVERTSLAGQAGLVDRMLRESMTMHH